MLIKISNLKTLSYPHLMNKFEFQLNFLFENDNSMKPKGTASNT